VYIIKYLRRKMIRELLKSARNYVESMAGKSVFAANLLREINEYLAKPLPDPVAWMTEDGRITTGSNAPIKYGKHWSIPLYAEPPAIINQWRPIETAPKDGIEILLFSLGDIGVCYWSDEMKCWTWGLGKAFLNHSHWMPRPTPPDLAKPGTHHGIKEQ
jgi:hypothetical protein